MSNYQGYRLEDNVRRKANNTGESIDGIGKNKNVKSISSKPGQLSAKSQVYLEQLKLSRLNKKQPVKTIKDLSQELIRALTTKYCCKTA